MPRRSRSGSGASVEVTRRDRLRMRSPDPRVDSPPMSVGARVRGQLAKHAPKLEEAVVRANWRRHNRGRAFDRETIHDPLQRRLVDELRRDGVAVTTFHELIGEGELWSA